MLSNNAAIRCPQQTKNCTAAVRFNAFPTPMAIRHHTKDNEFDQEYGAVEWFARKHPMKILMTRIGAIYGEVHLNGNAFSSGQEFA